MEPKINIELTEQEAGVLMNLIHEAVKAKGLEAAEAAAHFKNKISTAHAESKKKQAATDLTNLAEFGNELL